jgi:hypothetical protein
LRGVVAVVDNGRVVMVSRQMITDADMDGDDVVNLIAIRRYSMSGGDR